MRVGLHIPDFTWEGVPPALRARLGEVAHRAEDAGVDRISVTDHVWQIGHLGPPEHEMVREHCASEGRDLAEIEKTAQTRFDLGKRGERVEQTIEHLHELAELGIQVAHGGLAGVGSPRPLDLMAERVIPAVEKF
jgi:hypothetical protein